MHRAAKAFWFPGLGGRWSRPRHARRVAAVIVAGAVTALAGTACTPAASGPGAAGHGAPPVTVLMQGAGNGNGNGDIFIAPQGAGGYASGPEILTNTGKVIWFHALPAGETATDFRTQTYQGRPVLTWFQGSHHPRPASAATVWDWFHINAVHLDTDGNLQVNSRYTWTTYKVNLRTGKIIWELGGKQSTFKLTAAPGQVLDTAGEIFACPTSPSSAHPGTCCSTHSSRPASAPTAPTVCPGTRPVSQPGHARRPEIRCSSRRTLTHDEVRP